MAKKEKVSGPAGGAGLIRYFDVDEGGPKLDPKTVIYAVLAIILVLEISKILIR